MEQTECKYEAIVVQAARTGNWNDELRKHLDSCLFCRGTAALGESLTSLAEATDLPGSLPNARLIWLKAQVIKKQKRAVKLELYSRLGLVFSFGLGVAAMLEWKTSLIGSVAGLASHNPPHSWAELLTATLPFSATAALMLIMRLVTPDRERRRSPI